VAVETNTVGYCIWGADNAVYGPVELPALIAWVKDSRVLADTWIYDGNNDRWRKASAMPELQLFFRKKSAGASTGDTQQFFDGSEITPYMLRRAKALSELHDDELNRLACYMEPLAVRSMAQVVKQGGPDDGMYLVMDGELRVRLMISGKETILATLGPGDCFGEMALFDQGPRSADVVANTDSILLKISSEAFDKLRREAPEISTPILFSISKTLAARIRADNRRIKDSVRFASALGS
jgi:CRP-like cAMP-binding protein